ncbi:MAG: hypothetical protein WDO19_22360 [Bacteroidota bacterium]
MDEPWLEGCVIVDKLSMHLYFWTLEFSRETSVIEYYVSELAEKWNGWKVSILKNRMYDAEKILGIDYVSKQELPKLYIRSKDDVINDKVEEWETAVVIIKEGDRLLVTKTGNMSIEAVIGYGQEIIPLLRNKQVCELPCEEEAVTYECVVIDIPNKKIFINESSFGLWEQSKHLWNGYDMVMGDFGYIGTLRLAAIDTSKVMMPIGKVIEQFKNIVKQPANFEPSPDG